jgi:hypothetical protein
VVLALAASSALASSHREAPAISFDPAADLTDFYAFVNPNDTTKVVFIMNVNPLSNPGGGPNFHRFDDDVRYEIKCDNEGDANEDIVYGFEFDTTYQYPNEFLYNVGSAADPAFVNIQQTMRAWRSDDVVGTVNLATAASPIDVAPINVGVNSVIQGTEYSPNSSTPGSTTTAHVATRGVHRLFAGPRQEGFFVDLEQTFDLLGLSSPVNTLLGYNVHSIAIEVPAIAMTRNGLTPSAANQNEVIACWATTSRRARKIYMADGSQAASGAWVQVSRLGNPLVNEVVIPISEKDRFNASHPRDDAQFLGWVTDPILPIYMEAILGVTNPISYDDAAVPNAVVPQPARDDLVLAFLTGHPAVGNLPTGFVLGGAIPGEAYKYFAAFEALRVDLSVASGFPNGRAVGDDVVDTALSAMGGLLISGVSVPDGVTSTGLHFLTDFPFLGDPWGGDDHPQAYHDVP